VTPASAAILASALLIMGGAAVAMRRS